MSYSVDPIKWAAVGDGITDDTEAFRSMFQAIPAGSIVQSAGNKIYRLTGQLDLKKPVKLRGGTYLAAPQGTTFMLDSREVTLENLSILGDESAWSSSPLTGHYFISTTATAIARQMGHRIRNVRMRYCRGDFVRLSWIRDFQITDCDIRYGQYAGIMILSGENGFISKNTVVDLIMGSPLVNAYGIAISDVENSFAGRSRFIDVENNYIEGVRDWEGLDTHGGYAITFRNNTVVSCRTPIAVTTGNINRLVPPEMCIVENNTVIKGSANSETAGIVFNGKSADRLCSGILGSNTIIGFEKDLIVDWYDPTKMLLSPQVTDAIKVRAPDGPLWRTWVARTTVKSINGSSGGSTAVTFPSEKFTVPPVVLVTKQSGVGAKYTPYVTEITSEGCKIGIYDPTGPNGEVVIPIAITAIQATSKGAVGSARA